MSFLQKEEIDNIKKVVNELYPNSNYACYNIENLLEQWENSKKKYIKLFNNQLIYQYKNKVKIDLYSYEKEKIFKKLLDNLYENFIFEEKGELIYFLEKNGYEAFYNNKVVDNCNYDKIKLGMKIIKSFKYIVKDENILHKIQDYASIYIQESSIEGYLCISVHPLDYLSLSENCNNWRSCHALDGSYRGGNLSYMVDESTVIVYIKNDNNLYKLPNFPADVLWNNKKWRRLLHFSDNFNFVVAGRPYPHNLKNILSFIQNNIFEEINLNNFKNNKWNKINPRDFNIKPGSLSLNFNDVLDSSCYSPVGLMSDNYNDDTLIIGGASICPICGEKYVSSEDQLICDDCLNNFSSFCYCCDDNITKSNFYFVYNEYNEEVKVCEYCFENHVSRCPICGEYYLSKALSYNSKLNDYICHYCEESEEF